MLVGMRALVALTVLALSSGCRAAGQSGAAALAALERRVEERALARERLPAFRAARPASVPGDPTELSRVANAWLATLGTSHTEFRMLHEPRAWELADVFWETLDERERQRVFGTHGPRLAGIGVVLDQGANGPFVRAVLDGSPAAHAGMRVGERILRVEGEPFEPVASFRGRAGETLALELVAPDGEARTLDVVPDEARPRERWLAALRASAEVRVQGGRALAYVHVWSWAGEEVDAALRELLFEGELAQADGLVLDLRDGVGGANPEALALFACDVPVLEWRNAAGTGGVRASAWKKPVVLLVDEHTTSGKEVLARAFQRAARGPLVGARTAGAVLGGSLALLPGPSVLYLAELDVLVDGERLEGVGVTPAVLVPWKRENGGPDRPRERAFEVLRKELGVPR
jgi:carboxyl-terminal processing protease